MTVNKKSEMKKEFQNMVAGIHPDQVRFREYMLAELRCARTRAKMLVNEIETIGVALKGEVIDSETAIQWLKDANALKFLIERPKEDGDDDGVEGYADAAEAGAEVASA